MFLQTIHIDGTISSDGASSAQLSSSGAGSGGSLKISTDTLHGFGKLSTDGGQGGGNTHFGNVVLHVIHFVKIVFVGFYKLFYESKKNSGNVKMLLYEMCSC